MSTDKTTKTTGPRPACLCGCGDFPASGDFRPGHDARLRSLFLRCLGVGRAGRKVPTLDAVARCGAACFAAPVRESRLFAPLVAAFVAAWDARDADADAA